MILPLCAINYKSGNFRGNLIFAKSVKRRTCDWKISLLGYDLPISLVNRVILRGLYTKFRENKTLGKISEFTVIVVKFRS